MEKLKTMKETLMSCVQAQMTDLKNTNAKDLGEAIDMIKDLAEAEYYCSITKAMEESEKGKDTMKYTYPPIMYNGGGMSMNEEPRYYSSGTQSSGGRMYYNNSGNNGNGSSSRYYNGGDNQSQYMGYGEYPMEIRDYREGRSPMTRRTYMESKEMHHGKEKQMKELEKYMGELTQDIMEMINDASPDEKVMLSQKLTTLADKIK